MIQGKVIQVTVSDRWIVALCEDGSIWRKATQSQFIHKYDQDWYRVG